MDTVALQRFKEVLGQHDRVAIVVGKNPSVDEMGAALSLYLSLKTSHKATIIASASQPIVELSSLVGIDEVKGSVGSAGGDLVVSFPYQEGEIEKVSYTIENGLLNIVVKAGENGLNFQEQDVNFTRGGGLPSLLIAVGTPQFASFGDLLSNDALKDLPIINIDNKAENEGYGEVVLVAPQFSSVSEQMANLIMSNGLPMDVDTAQNLMLGISFATNNFQSPSTSYFAFEIVAELMRRGAVRPQIQAAQPQTPSYMQQPQVSNQQQPRPQAPRPQQQQPRPNYNQSQPQRNQPQQQQSHNAQPRVNQGQRVHQNQQPRPAHQGQNNQPQNNRQDEIRRALAEQARAMQQPQVSNQQQPVSQPAQPLPNPVQQPQPQQQSPIQQPQEAAPSDWLTPKVYKGSSNPS